MKITFHAWGFNSLSLSYVRHVQIILSEPQSWCGQWPRTLQRARRGCREGRKEEISFDLRQTWVQNSFTVIYSVCDFKLPTSSWTTEIQLCLRDNKSHPSGTEVRTKLRSWGHSSCRAEPGYTWWVIPIIFIVIITMIWMA